MAFRRSSALTLLAAACAAAFLATAPGAEAWFCAGSKGNFGDRPCKRRPQPRPTPSPTKSPTKSLPALPSLLEGLTDAQVRWVDGIKIAPTVDRFADGSPIGPLQECELYLSRRIFLKNVRNRKLTP